MTQPSNKQPRICIKRVYDEPGPEDGTRVLVDRIWPRGLSKEKAAVDEWLKSVAPSTELRKWYGHDPQRWDEFRRRYLAELTESQPEGLDRLKQLLAQSPRVTLVFSSREREGNNAAALKQFLDQGEV